MKERKYRAYNPETKEMIYFDLKKAAVDQYIATHLIILLANDHGLGKDLLTEFTGLQDKNGVDIYESDLLRINLVAGQKVEGEVYRCSGGAYSCCGYSVVSHTLESEVIGNIHENKELLAQGG